MKKRNNEIFMQSPGTGWQSISRDAGQAAVQSNNYGQWEDRSRYSARINGGCIGRKQKNPFSNQERGPSFRVISEAQICVSPDYILAGATGNRRASTP